MDDISRERSLRQAAGVEIQQRLIELGIPKPAIPAIMDTFTHPLFRAMNIPLAKTIAKANLVDLWLRDRAECDRVLVKLCEIRERAKTDFSLWQTILEIEFHLRTPRLPSTFLWPNLEVAFSFSKPRQGQGASAAEKSEILRQHYFSNYQVFDGQLRKLHSLKSKLWYEEELKKPQLGLDRDPGAVHYWDNYNRYGGH